MVIYLSGFAITKNHSCANRGTKKKSSGKWSIVILNLIIVITVIIFKKALWNLAIRWGFFFPKCLEIHVNLKGKRMETSALGLSWIG